jgi:hypothetical protein
LREKPFDSRVIARRFKMKVAHYQKERRRNTDAGRLGNGTLPYGNPSSFCPSRFSLEFARHWWY